MSRRISDVPDAGILHRINNQLGIIAQASQNVERRLSAPIPANLDAAERAGADLERLQAYLVLRDIPTFLRDIREAAACASRLVAGMTPPERRDG